jgi:hypothetical protein
MLEFVVGWAAHQQVELKHVAGGLFVYLAMNWWLSKLNINWRKSRVFRAVVFTHNSLLAVFSIVTFYYVVSVFRHTFSVRCCSVLSAVPGLRGIAYLFYLSKYVQCIFHQWFLVFLGRILAGAVPAAWKRQKLKHACIFMPVFVPCRSQLTFTPRLGTMSSLTLGSTT